ncbi:hypothetical protein [Aeromicrobium sp. CTD01-1L150]|uniref:hypothetical protein n=1 Tax=Aeromicrobium sp. CTD01-1L150 TaxID=3341830 RepID=UPI0035BF06DC
MARGSRDVARTYWIIGALLVCVVVLVALFLFVLRDGGPDRRVVDAASDEVTSEVALDAVDAWAAEGEELGDTVRVLWEGETEHPSLGPATMVVLASGDVVVSALRTDSEEQSWRIFNSEGADRTHRVLRVETGYLLNFSTQVHELQVWCPGRGDSEETQETDDGHVTQLSVDAGLVSGAADGCVSRGTESEPTIWFGDSDVVPVFDRKDAGDIWQAVTSSDGQAVRQAAQTAIGHMQQTADDGLAPDQVEVEVLGAGRGPQGLGAPEDRAVAVVVRSADPPPGSVGTVVAAALRDSVSVPSYVLGEQVGAAPRPVLAAAWIGPDERHDGRPFLIYAMSQEVESPQLRVGRQDVDAEGPIGFVPLPESAGDRVTQLPTSFIGLDGDGYPVTAMDRPS